MSPTARSVAPINKPTIPVPTRSKFDMLVLIFQFLVSNIIMCIQKLVLAIFLIQHPGLKKKVCLVIELPFNNLIIFVF